MSVCDTDWAAMLLLNTELSWQPPCIGPHVVDFQKLPCRLIISDFGLVFHSLVVASFWLVFIDLDAYFSHTVATQLTQSGSPLRAAVAM